MRSIFVFRLPTTLTRLRFAPGSRIRSTTNWFTLQLEGQKPKSNIAALDGVRALACLSVVLFHLSLITTRDVPLWKPSQFNIIISALAFTGDTGVTLFFVL